MSALSSIRRSRECCSTTEAKASCQTLTSIGTGHGTRPCQLMCTAFVSDGNGSPSGTRSVFCPTRDFAWPIARSCQMKKLHMNMKTSKAIKQYPSERSHMRSITISKSQVVYIQVSIPRAAVQIGQAARRSSPLIKTGNRHQHQHIYKTIESSDTTKRQRVSSSQRKCCGMASHGLSRLWLWASNEVLVLDCHTLCHMVDFVHAD